ncbi:PAS domain-containing sensor histidine kinase [Spirosoma oryzicola]|uniref:PAS domain-containing sensor histidine kinase n=1 Tax=Spirosoma oryzicola TaxID=2898794 RepID=UPI001E56F2A4|nr:PAS domain-containing protein [Spirosoma oryzicola]UHG94637.1 PAS domain-containing protein [Spirosoma oryzicola]
MLIQQVNAPMLAIWGKDSSVIGKTLHQAMPELAGQPFLAQLQHVFETGEPFRHEEGMADMIQNGQAKRVWFNHAYNPLYEETGRIYGVINVAIDVTAQVLARQKIEESKAHLQLLRDTVPAMIFYLDAQQRYQSYNKVFREWFGVGDEVMGKTVREFIGEPAYQQTEPHLAQAYAGQPTQYDMHAPSRMQADRWLRIVYTPHRDATGQVLGVIVHATDINPSKRMELSLSASEARYRTLSADLEQQVQSRTDELATANQELAASNQELAASNQEYAVLNTHLEEANTDLLRSNQNLEQFAYIASHDLQEPLRKIQQFGDLLQTRLAESVGGEELAYLGRMQVAASRMSRLIKDLLAFSRIATSQAVAYPVSLGKVVRLVLDSLSVVIEESRAQIEVAELPTVQGDALQLGQLFQNLLSNALKFRRTDGDGTVVIPQIRVQARLISPSELPVLVKPPRTAATYHLIEVTDNGIGFEEKYLDRIFQVFQRLHGKNEFAGTGVGLAIVQKVVTNHGGGITASGKPDQGATFCVYLPA